MAEIIRRAATNSWPLRSGWGCHRAIVKVDRPGNAVLATIEWRRRDPEPEKIGVRIKHQAFGEEIDLIYIRKSTKEVGEIIFYAPHDGIYEIYYLPFVIKGKGTHVPSVKYLKAEDMKVDSEWKASIGNNYFGSSIIAIEGRTEFDRFNIMEVTATSDEIQDLKDKHREEEFLLFPEDRTNSIRMLKELPQRWIDQGPDNKFKGFAQPGEYYVFQVGVWALRDLDNLEIEFVPTGKGKELPISALTCFNTTGVDCLGRTFIKELSVEKGVVQPLWFGVDLADDAHGDYDFDIKISSPLGKKTVHVELNVAGEIIPDRGDGDLWRLSRLRWLNSTIGIDSDITYGYTPLEVQGAKVSCLGREVSFNEMGLPSCIKSFFSPNGNDIQDKAVDIISQPVEIQLTSGMEFLHFAAKDMLVEQVGSGRVLVNAQMSATGILATNKTVMEFDGHIDTIITFMAEKDISIDNLQLVLPINKEAAAYMMGMGKQGGIRPGEWQYKWDIDRANNLVWIGAPNAGIQIKLKHTEDVWEVYNYQKQGVPNSWDNEGKGGCNITEKDDIVVLEAYTGARVLKVGETISLRYSLLITPLKLIDSDAHWNQRYHHIDTWKEDMPSLEEAAKVDATIVNLHQGGVLNQFINYPFLKSREIREQTKKAHDLGLKYKIYYTVRELSNRAEELWMIRSLGDEILRIGQGFRLADHFLDDKNQSMTGGPWLVEHLQDDFVPAWQQILKDGDYDSAVSINGITRWHNHYLEGLAWLMEKDGVDGIYLDGVGYDRQIMKRVRKAMDSVKEGCLIDFHSGNDFDPRYGLNSPMNAYLELMPSVDSLWLGEGYDYEKQSADYWLTEVSGIPFGLMGDMLSKGGNPWRGMVFGMTCRYGWQQGGNPVPLWQFWKSFGMEGVKMHGWWAAGCPVVTDYNDVKATIFDKEDKTLISIASWEKETVDVRIHIDCEALGLSDDGIVLEAPYIENFQESKVFKLEDSIPVEPRRGWLLVLRKK